MDIKKLFDYEHALQNQRPEFTQEENYNALVQPEKVSEITSFSLTAGGKEGMFIKFVNKDGSQTSMAHLNPVVAKHLVEELTNTLAQQGFELEEKPGQPTTDSRTYH
jgi:hypothetical protein